MNVKETLKRLHKKFPMMGLDELFELLDCYVEENFSSNISTWELPSKIYYSTDKITSVNEVPKINCTDGKIKYYDGGGSTQLVANH